MDEERARQGVFKHPVISDAGNGRAAGVGGKCRILCLVPWQVAHAYTISDRQLPGDYVGAYHFPHVRALQVMARWRFI